MGGKEGRRGLTNVIKIVENKTSLIVYWTKKVLLEIRYNVKVIVSLHC